MKLPKMESPTRRRVSKPIVGSSTMNELLGQQAFSLISQPSELSDALLDLSVSEIRLIQLAIMNSREIKGEINTSTPLTVSA